MTLPFAVDPMLLRFFLLLLAGHILSDFFFQTAGIARDKGRKVSVLLQHGLLTFAVHTALFFPFWNGSTLFGIAALAVLHIGIDWLKPRIFPNDGKTLTAFFLDQGVHLLTLLALTWAISCRGDVRVILLSDANLDVYIRAMLITAGFAFNGKGGTAVVRLILDRFPDISAPLREDRNDAYAMGLMLSNLERLREDRTGAYAMGQMIGNLERFILFVMVLLGHWGALGFVIAAKSIARFKELDEKGFADYYLIGTLASVLVAIISGVTVDLLMGLL